MTKTVIQELAEFGQSVWLDNISRSLIDNGKFKEMINLGLRGVTSNPTIFEKSITTTEGYDNQIKKLCSKGKSTIEIYDSITINDICETADIFKPVYKETRGLDGYVSLEINPQWAANTEMTIEEGMRLYRKVNRPNVMFKVPATEESLPAIEELIAMGININVTLIFSVEQYTKTAAAYLRGVKRLLNHKKDAAEVHSVASIFVSRIDTVIDKMLDDQINGEKDEIKKKNLLFLKGKAAVSNSRLIYNKHKETFSSQEWKICENKRAHIQRVLWGSTSTKNPAYSDVKYVEELIGKNTVNTLPDNTFWAFLDHGKVKDALDGQIDNWGYVIENLKNLGIDINDVCKQLLEDGVLAFQKSFQSLLNSIEEKGKYLPATGRGV